MKYRTVDRLQIIFLVVFLALCVWLFFAHPAPPPAPTDPKARCEAKGDWWDAEDHVCAVPMPLSRFTGRSAKPGA
ncbi:MAG TPA: hypothetical protein VJP88_09215 [Caulobacteraceae bacterium]|nr:hypothetical protein [Caulobacteraceae bacterium]